APQEPAYRYDLAGAHDHLGGTLHETNQPSKAEASFRTAQTLLEQLVEQYPHEDAYRDRLAQTINNRGLVCEKAGRIASAEQCFRRGSGHPDPTVADSADVAVSRDQAAYRRRLARYLNNMAGILVRDKDRHQEAGESVRKSLELRQSVAEQFFEEPVF